MIRLSPEERKGCLSKIASKVLYRKEQAISRLRKTELQKIKNLDQSIDPNVIPFLFISMRHWTGYRVKDGKNFNLEARFNQNIKVISHGMEK